MAVDKLVDSTQLNSDLSSIANAIRTKGGTSSQLAFPSGFVSAVEAIPTGGGGAISVLETITIPSDTRAVNIDLTNYQNYNLFFIIADMELTSSDWVYYVKNGSSESGGTYDGQALRHNFIIAEQANPAGEANKIFSGSVGNAQFMLGTGAMTNLYIYTYNASNTIKAGSTFKICGGNYADI